MSEISHVDENARWTEIRSLTDGIVQSDAPPTATEAALCGAVYRACQLERALKLKEMKIEALEHELTEANCLRQSETDVWSSMVAEANVLKCDNARLVQANADLATELTRARCDALGGSGEDL